MIMKRVVFAGDRLFRKFPNRDFFVTRLHEVGTEAVFADGADDAGLRELAAGAAAIVVIDRRIDRATLSAMTRPELIMTLSVGYDCVEVPAATDLGIPVSNCPTYCIDEVATHAITLLHAVTRKLHQVLPETLGANWGIGYAKPIHSFRGRVLGIIGLGRIGRAFARKAEALDVQLAAYDPYVDDDIFAMLGVERMVDLEDLLEASDYLSIHAPLTGETRHMINAATIAKMRPHAYLVNTARGAIIREADLLAALQDGRIAGAALDVLEVEPPAADHPLFSEPRALITPHMAWYSEESFLANQELGMEELTRVLTGHRPQYVVNPEVLGRKNRAGRSNTE